MSKPARHRINVHVSMEAYEKLQQLARLDRNMGQVLESLIMDVSVPIEPNKKYEALEATRLYLAVVPIQFMRI